MTETEDPLISVCIANYNGALIIEECLRSLADQVDPPSFEIIVHDDASTDDSLRVLKTIGNIRLIASPSNVGFCVSNNRMAAAARGRCLLLLNNDAVLLPDALRTLYDASCTNTSDPVLSLPQYDYSSGELLDRGMRIDPFANPVPVTGIERTELAMVMGACLWVSSGLWREIGGFPEWIDSIGEDLYLCCYARLLGHPIRVPPTSGYRHRVGSSFGGGKVVEQRLSTTLRRRALSERNKTFVIIVCYPLPLLMLILPVHLALLTIEGAVLGVVKRSYEIFARIYAAAIVAAWRERATLRRARNAVQAARRAGSRQFASAMNWVPHKLRLLCRHGIPSIH